MKRASTAAEQLSGFDSLKAVGRILGLKCPEAVRPANLATDGHEDPRSVGINVLVALVAI
jgi:hypothetical protein